MCLRLEWFMEIAHRAANGLPNAAFHRMIVEGLLALYLSDDKVHDSADLRRISREWLRNSPPTRKFFVWNSRWIRKIF